MSKRVACLALLALVAGSAVGPVWAQEGGQAAASGGVNWGILGGAFAIAIAAAGGATGQSRAIAAAVSALARNPGAAGDIRFALILGLALIESLVIYALVIALRGAAFF
jgi:F-type H+-transporting ATPase subunit c